MTSARTVFKNTGVLFISQIITYVMGFFITMYTARYLGAEGFGIISLALSLTGIIVVFTDLGLGTLTIREIARNKDLDKKYIPNTFFMKIILSVLTFVIVALIVNILGYDQTISTVVYIITLSIVINAIGGVFSVIFQANEKMEYISINSIINSALMLIGTAIGIIYQFDIFFFAALYVISNIFCLIFIMVMYFRNFTLPSMKIDFSFWKPTMKEASFFAISSVFVSIYFYIDSVLLSVLDSTAAVGIYTAAYRLIFVLLFIPNVIIIALFPVMSRHFESNKDLLKIEYEKTFKYLFVIAIYLLFNGIIFADNIINIIYGSGFTQSILALQILMFVVPIIFITSLFGNLLGAINKQRFVTIVAGLNALLNVGMNIVLIPILGFVGAALATVFTELLGFVIMFTYISRFFLKISVKENILKTVLSGIIVSAMIYLIKIEFNWILACILGLLIYILILYVLKIITKEDIELFREAFQ